MKLRPVFNRRLGHWVICHDQWCKPGETSIVATIMNSLDAEADEKIAREICERFNRAAEVVNG